MGLAVIVAQHISLLVDVTIRHDFIGAGRSGLTQGQLRNPDNPDHILESAAADKIRNYRDTYHRRRACLHRDVSTASSCACSSSSPTKAKPTITLLLLVTRHTRRSCAIAAVSSSAATTPRSSPSLHAQDQEAKRDCTTSLAHLLFFLGAPLT